MARILKKGAAIGLGVAFFLVFCPVKFAQYFYGKLLLRNTAGYASVADVFAEVICSIDEALKDFMPQAQSTKEEVKSLTEDQKKAIAKAADVEFDREFDNEYHFYAGEANGQTVGYAAKDTVRGKWGLIKYVISFNPDGSVKDVCILELLERRGRPVKDRRFLDQFMGKSINDKIKLNKDVKGVAGATVSSRGMTNGIRKMTYVFNELYKK